MGATFMIGEQKTRPGVYFRYDNYGTPLIAGADNGKCAAVFQADWGPVNKVVVLESYNDVINTFGNGGTTAVMQEQFNGGAQLVYAVRLGGGTGGSQGAYAIKDTTGAAAINLTLDYPGSRTFLLTIGAAPGYPDKSELILMEQTATSITVLEQFLFDTTPAGSDQVTALLATAGGSAYFTLTEPGVHSSKPLAAIDQAAITGGADPAAPGPNDYNAAFNILEAYRWNVLSIDTTDQAITQGVMQPYLNRIYKEGNFAMGVVGADTTATFATRLTDAMSYNDYQIVYVGAGFIDAGGNRHEGWRAAARIAGLIASTPSNQSITHMSITGAGALTEPLTNNQYERAIKAGMLTFSTSSAGIVWVEQGVNTMQLPPTNSNNDSGWSKIKRVKVRFELMQRLNDTVEGLVGRINNDPDGRMTIIQCANAVCNDMVGEYKLLSGAHCEIDPQNPPQGDSAWFLVYADDIDALEKMYFTFKFRFAPDGQTA